MITMKEIGRLAGVSQTAVSFILNGKAEKLSLSKATVNLVEQIAREHNYSPNILARGMKRGRTGVIGLLLFDRTFRQIADGENFINIYMRLQAKLLYHGHSVIMEPISWQDVEDRRFPASVTSGLLDTALLAFDDFFTPGCTSAITAYIKRLREYCPGCLCIPSLSSGEAVHFSREYHAGELAAEDLWRRGARSFAVLGRTPASPGHLARAEGFCDRIAGLSGSRQDIPYYGATDCWVPECGNQMMRGLLAAGRPLPEGIIALVDYFVNGAVDELRKNGIDDRSIAFAAIGDSLRQINCNYPMSYVGFDDSLWLEHLFQHLTGKIVCAPEERLSEPALVPFSSY